MKTKTLIYLALIASIPAFLSVLIVATISLEWWLVGQGKFAQLFLTGQFNKGFSLIFFGMGVISLPIIMLALSTVARYADQIDKLDEAKMQWYESKRKYDAATKKLLSTL